MRFSCPFLTPHRPSRRRNLLQILVMALWMPLMGDVLALELPPPEKLEQDHGVRRQTVRVAEPHEAIDGDPVRVGYVALPMDKLLDAWFGDDWKTPEAEIVFLAQDGYRSVIPGSRFRRDRAYLAFARDDGAAFKIDNPAQNETGISLGPYYLIWDDAPDRRHLGAYGWPYQVARVELRSASEDRALRPSGARTDGEKGLAEAKEYCLTCHNIRGVGGEKYREDLVRATCRWQDADLKAWLDDPRRIRSATTMPPLNPLLPVAARRDAIEAIVGYLKAMRADDPSACSAGR